MGKLELIKGDCLEHIGAIPSSSIDLVLADPPYGTTRCRWDSAIPLDPLWRQLKRVIKREGAIVLTASQPFTTELIHSNKDMFKYTWVWEKSQSSSGLSAFYQPLKSHEDIIVFSKAPASRSPNSPMNYNPQMVEGTPYRGEIDKEGNHTFHGNIDIKDRKANEGVRFPRSVIRDFKRERGLHPTQKPTGLMEYLILTYTQEGATVLDFCMGSGTTGVACRNTGRDFIGIEKDPEYFQTVQERTACW